MGTLEFDLFGQPVVVARVEGAWVVSRRGGDGKRRPARDIVVPSHLPEREVERYLEDVRHESATARHPRVVRLR